MSQDEQLIASLQAKIDSMRLMLTERGVLTVTQYEFCKLAEMALQFCIEE